MLVLLCAVAAPGAVSAEPMRLDDATPRWVVVQFEDSPSSHPERLDQVYTKPFAAWLEPDARGRLVVRVPADTLEQNFFPNDVPVPGSFSDYVWVFDPATRDVSASFSGVFAHTIGLGIASTTVEARVRADMATDREGGFEPPQPMWGRRLRGWCEKPAPETGCRPVASVRYDARRGYVNATGFLAIDSALVQFMTFSALGEARFSEVPTGVAVTPPVAAGPAADPARVSRGLGNAGVPVLSISGPPLP